MKSLRVALIVKNKPSAMKRDKRNMGYWSYPVPEFTWKHFSPGDGFRLKTRDFAPNFDLIFHEDGGNYGTYLGGAIPVVYLAIDSTLTRKNHFIPRHKQAGRADLILLDHDRAERFLDLGKPARQWNYCVNDRVFSDPGAARICDFSFHCSGGRWAPGTEERSLLRQQLHGLAQEEGYVYRSGIRGLEDYAYSMAESKIVVNLPRTLINRPHRVFDAMACGACLLTAPIPTVPGDGVKPDVHYIQWRSPDHLVELLRSLLTSGDWQAFADRGHDFVMQHHTWAIRARQLRLILKEEFGI